MTNVRSASGEPAGGLVQRLRRHVGILAGEIGERHMWRPAALLAAADYIRAAFVEAGHEVHMHGYRVNDVHCDNIEIVIPGASMNRQIVLAGAHYDTVQGSPGADDNASGVAAVIEIARALRGLRPLRTVKLVAFVNEEPPFFFFGEMGSKVYAQAARRRGDDIRVMLSLEMLGCYFTAPGTQSYPPLLRWFYPDSGDYVAFVSNLRSRHRLREVIAAYRQCSDFPAHGLACPAFVPGVAWSDQLSFWRAGYPGVMVTDTAFYRYPHYHRDTDTPDRLDYRRMAAVVAGLAHTIRMLSGWADDH